MKSTLELPTDPSLGEKRLKKRARREMPFPLPPKKKIVIINNKILIIK